MPGKKKLEIEFQYYEIPHGEQLLAVSGKPSSWGYGENAKNRKQHFHNLLEVGYCAAGSGKICFGDKKADYSQGMITIIPQNLPHLIGSGMHSMSQWEYLFFNPEDLLKEFYPENPLFAKKILESVNQRERCYAAGEKRHLTLLVRMIIEECKNKGGYSGEYVRGLLLSVLIAVARSGTKADEMQKEDRFCSDVSQISAALEYIGERYMEHIKTKTLAAACNLSETHFRRLFAEYMKMTPLEYINLVRIQKACDLMKKTRYSMEEVAARVGYPAISTFNRNFRKIIGTSPYQYKKSG